VGRWLRLRLDQAWRQVKPRVVRLGADPGPESLAAEWSACLARVRSLFAAHYGAEAVTARFAVPADYATFMTRYGGDWRWPDGLVQDLYSAADVAAVTAREFASFVTEREEEDAPQDDGLWLSIAHYADKHDILLCCDRAHQYRGQVVDYHDSHPWLNGAVTGSMVLGRSFLGWLRALGGAA
jgi:hypothetical protein